MEKRMYFLVPYNISEIQKSIQAGHAQMEYALKYWGDEDFQDWANNYKTWIILNGGTTRYHTERFPTIGGMQSHLLNLEINEIKTASFEEPDINNALTAIAFICDERVYDIETYPLFKIFLLNRNGTDSHKMYKSLVDDTLSNDFPDEYKEWLELIGGEKNAFLKEFISRFKLA